MTIPLPKLMLATPANKVKDFTEAIVPRTLNTASAPSKNCATAQKASLEHFGGNFIVAWTDIPFFIETPLLPVK